MVTAAKGLLVSSGKDGLDVSRGHSGIGEKHKGVEPEVRHFVRKLLVRTILGGDDHFGGFFSNLLCDAVDTTGQQSGQYDPSGLARFRSSMIA